MASKVKGSFAPSESEQLKTQTSTTQYACFRMTLILMARRSLRRSSRASQGVPLCYHREQRLQLASLLQSGAGDPMFAFPSHLLRRFFLPALLGIVTASLHAQTSFG